LTRSTTEPEYLSRKEESTRVGYEIVDFNWPKSEKVLPWIFREKQGVEAVEAWEQAPRLVK